MAFDHKHLIDITEYSADDIMTILETAKTFKQVNERRIKKVPTLKGFTVVNMFNEPSPRTRSSRRGGGAGPPPPTPPLRAPRAPPPPPKHALSIIPRSSYCGTPPGSPRRTS